MHIQKKNKRFKQVFEGTEGQFVLSSLLDMTGFYKSSFVSGDPYQTAYNEGKRAIALNIIQILGLSEQDIRELVRAYREDVVASEAMYQGFQHRL